MIEILLALLVATQSGPLVVADDSELAVARKLVFEEEWNRASKVTRRLASSRAKDEQTPDEAEWLAELCRIRAVAEAGSGKARLADWYWWVSELFEASSVSDLETRYGEGGKKLAGLIKDPPPIRPVQTPRKPLRTQVKREQGTRPAIFRSACKNLGGFVHFTAHVDEDGYYRTPRSSPLQPFTQRPLCVFAVLETYRDRRVPGAAPGAFHQINERIDIVRGRL